MHSKSENSTTNCRVMYWIQKRVIYGDLGPHTQHWKKKPVANTKSSFTNLQMMNSEKKKLSHLDSAVSFGWACVLNPNLSGGSDRPIKTTYRQSGAALCARSSSWEDNFLSGLYWRNYSLMEFAVEDWRYSNCSLRDSFFFRTLQWIFFGRNLVNWLQIN